MSEFITRYFAKLPLVPKCDPTGTTSTAVCNAGDFQQLIVNVIQFLINISLIVAVVFIMWGGFLLLASGGSIGTKEQPGRIVRGKKAITSAVIGIVIVLVAMSAINIFLDLFTSCEGRWWDFQPLSC